jgi:tRNA A-37 threonylcarbamoyl transferase component Bud32/tetratricopeptide (TPR) repeat protein
VIENPRPSRPDHIGRYRVVDRIGRGAMGVVYAAHDDLMDRDVAVKVMMTDLEAEPDIRARFLREAQVCAKLSHRNIVTVFDIGEDNGRLFIVMELLRGQTLDKCLKQGTLSIEEKVDLTLEVCEGLAVAAAGGVCHRDVKPGNLFLQADGGVKILDFGIARLASSSMTASGFIVGTPDYMSPEQARGVAIDERSDIFSVGAVLYFMLAARKPFMAPDLPAVLHKVLSEEPPPIDPAAAPAPLARIVFKALAKDPNERFQKFPEFSSELARWRRRYEVETRALGDAVARTMDLLHGLATEERAAAEVLGVPPQSDPHAWLAEIAAGYPQVLANGAHALRSGKCHRSDVDEISRRINAVTAAWEPRIAALRAAGRDLAAATSQLEAGNARAALAGFDSVLRQVPSAAIQPLVDRAQALAAEQQACDDKFQNLLAEAADARGSGRLDAALALVEQAVAVQPQNLEARRFLMGVQHDLATAATEKARRCERCVERARRALQLEQLEEAERQLQLAAETGAANADIAIVTAALSEARSARDTADALIQEIAGELARARAEFQKGNRSAAIARLETLTSRYPSSAVSNAELARLRAEDQRLAGAERTLSEADRLAADAAAALAQGEADAATRLAEEALGLVPSHELALRTSALAHAHLREIAERTAREQRARRLVEDARALLARGRFDRAIKEARLATELDPSGSAAPALIAEAFRRRAEVAAVEATEKEALRRAAEVREELGTAASALRSKDFVRARMLAERALALDPDSSESKELITKIATAAALAVTTLEDDTIDLLKGELDPDATAVLAPVGDGSMWSWPLSLRLWLSRVSMPGVARMRFGAARHTKPLSAEISASRDTKHKEA